MMDEFDARDTVVVALAQEDTKLEEHGQMLATLQPEPRFDVVADLDRAKTLEYDRTTAYLIDKQGIVREIFPMIIHARPSWEVVLDELDQMLEGQSGK